MKYYCLTNYPLIIRKSVSYRYGINVQVISRDSRVKPGASSHNYVLPGFFYPFMNSVEGYLTYHAAFQMAVVIFTFYAPAILRALKKKGWAHTQRFLHSIKSRF